MQLRQTGGVHEAAKQAVHEAVRCQACETQASMSSSMSYLMPGPPVLRLEPLHGLGQVANLHYILKVYHCI